MSSCIFISVRIPVGHHRIHLIQVDRRVEAHLVQGNISGLSLPIQKLKCSILVMESIFNFCNGNCARGLPLVDSLLICCRPKIHGFVRMATRWR